MKPALLFKATSVATLRLSISFHGVFHKRLVFVERLKLNRCRCSIRYNDLNDIQLSYALNRNITVQQIMFKNRNEMNTAAWLSRRFFLAPKLDITAAMRTNLYQRVQRQAVMKYFF